MRTWRAAWIALPAALLGACSSALIENRPMAWEVAVANADQVASCAAKGGVEVGAAAYVWIFKRGDEAVEANLLQLARNAAVDAGGDTVVKGASPGAGRRAFSIYKCHP